MTVAPKRRTRSKGSWMRVRDADLLVRYMENADFSQARLARYCGCSRQFIHMLVTEERTTCTKQLGSLIEEALSVLPGTLFVAHSSPTTKRPASKRKTLAA